MTAFLEALLAARRPIVMEVKRQDADGNDLLGGRAVTDLVADYEAAGAPCLSVVTGRWFGGTPDLLREVTARTGLPVLQKDFITRPSQLADARDLGASAVLLTAGLLPRRPSQARRCGRDPRPDPVRRGDHRGRGRGRAPARRVRHRGINKDIATRERGAADIDRSAALLPALLRRWPLPGECERHRRRRDGRPPARPGLRGAAGGDRHPALGRRRRLDGRTRPPARRQAAARGPLTRTLSGLLAPPRTRRDYSITRTQASGWLVRTRSPGRTSMPIRNPVCGQWTRTSLDGCSTHARAWPARTISPRRSDLGRQRPVHTARGRDDQPLGHVDVVGVEHGFSRLGRAHREASTGHARPWGDRPRCRLSPRTCRLTAIPRPELSILMSFGLILASAGGPRRPRVGQEPRVGVKRRRPVYLERWARLDIALPWDPAPSPSSRRTPSALRPITSSTVRRTCQSYGRDAPA